MLLLLNSSKIYCPPSYVTNVGNRNSFRVTSEMAVQLQTSELIRSQRARARTHTHTHTHTHTLYAWVRRSAGKALRENEIMLTKDTRKIIECFINDA